MNKIRDSALLERATRGDSEAVDLLVGRYKALVYGLSFGRVRNQEDANDIAQQVFVSVFLNLKQLDDRTRFLPWLHRVTINACTLFQRQVKKTEALDPMQADADKIPSLLSKLAVEQALSCLSESTRRTLTLYYFGSYSLAEIASFLEVPVSTVKSRLRDGRTRLRKEMIEMVEETLQGLAPDETFTTQVRALIESAIKGHTETARRLLTEDPTLVGELGGVAEEHAEHMRAADADHGWTPLHLAAHYGNLGTVKLLIEYGADIEAVSQNSIANTPISAAAWGNHLDIVSYLIDRGANVNAPNGRGATALHRAIDAGRLPLAELLLSHGADPNIRDVHGVTSFMAANQRGMSDLIELLKKHRVQPGGGSILRPDRNVSP